MAMILNFYIHFIHTLKRMNFLKLTACICIMASLFGCMRSTFPSEQQPDVVLQIPSSVEEATFVWYLIRKIKFFEDNGYELSLPDDEIIDGLIQKSKANTLSTRDWHALTSLFSKKIYRQSDYTAGYEVLKKELPVANGAVKRFRIYQERWGFFIPETYTVVLTLYGPGGNYNPKNGKITLKATKDGRFARGRDPLETVLHEAVHIGIEVPVIKKFNVSHWRKERIVDKFMAFHFSDICPGYRMQAKADTSIDIILADPKVWNNLPDEVSRFLSNETRGRAEKQ